MPPHTSFQNQSLPVDWARRLIAEDPPKYFAFPGSEQNELYINSLRQLHTSRKIRYILTVMQDLLFFESQKVSNEIKTNFLQDIEPFREIIRGNPEFSGLFENIMAVIRAQEPNENPSGLASRNNQAAREKSDSNRGLNGSDGSYRDIHLEQVEQSDREEEKDTCLLKKRDKKFLEKEISENRANSSNIEEEDNHSLNSFDDASEEEERIPQLRPARDPPSEISNLESFDDSEKSIAEIQNSEVQIQRIEDSASANSENEQISNLVPKKAGKTQRTVRQPAKIKLIDLSQSKLTKKQAIESNMKYIELMSKESVFPPDFIYSKLFKIVKQNLKEFFVNPVDLVINSNGNISWPKGGKKTLAYGTYETEGGFYGLNYYATLGVRCNQSSLNPTKGSISSGCTDSNNFWWLLSKVYLNRDLLESAKECLDSFFSAKEYSNNKEEEKGENLTQQKSIDETKFTKLFQNSCHDYNSLMKEDGDLEGLTQEHISQELSYPIPPQHDISLRSQIRFENDENGLNELEDPERFKTLHSEKIDPIQDLITTMKEGFQIEPNADLTTTQPFIKKEDIIKCSEEASNLENQDNDCDIQDQLMIDQNLENEGRDSISKLEQKIEQIKESKIQELQVCLNNLIELNCTGAINDEEFHSELDKILDQLGELYYGQIAIRDGLVDFSKESQCNEPENECLMGEESLRKSQNENLVNSNHPQETELEMLIRHLQVQLISCKSSNLHSFQELKKQTITSKAIEEQHDFIKIQKDFSKSAVKPFKELYWKLFEQCRLLQKDIKPKIRKYRYRYGGWKIAVNAKRKRRNLSMSLLPENLCPNPSSYHKDTPYLSEKSDEINFSKLLECKQDLKKFQQKIEDYSLKMTAKTETQLKKEDSGTPLKIQDPKFPKILKQVTPEKKQPDFFKKEVKVETVQKEEKLEEEKDQEGCQESELGGEEEDFDMGNEGQRIGGVEEERLVREGKNLEEKEVMVKLEDGCEGGRGERQDLAGGGNGEIEGKDTVKIGKSGSFDDKSDEIMDGNQISSKNKQDELCSNNQVVDDSQDVIMEDQDVSAFE
ncbi:unnamed protein product [Moneuplotes crassus]|uniref:Uncharacterized protein n=1 Tax=Euplotes crassus TaxID=5936 RepID=A0AAD1UCM4_EUPCR|nr:unnamed protein product [Moneuplotes crassus]